MNIRIISGTDPPVLECLSAVESIDDALEIVVSCSERSTNRLLQARPLPASFFDLRTRFAGEFIQKLLNYRPRVAGVFKPEAWHGERFREYLAEARRGQ